MILFDQLKPKSGPTTPLPLVPDDGLYLNDPGIWWKSAMFLTPPRITAKFTRAFQKAWKQISEQDRRTLREFWGPVERITPGERPRPAIMFNTGRLSPGLLAACRGGRELIFDAFVVDRTTPSANVHIIAHELAHAISYPHGWYKQHECNADRDEECVACECRAYSYMAAWGFDPFYGSLPRRKRLTERFRRR